MTKPLTQYFFVSFNGVERRATIITLKRNWTYAKKPTKGILVPNLKNLSWFFRSWMRNVYTKFQIDILKHLKIYRKSRTNIYRYSVIRRFFERAYNQSHSIYACQYNIVIVSAVFIFITLAIVHNELCRGPPMLFYVNIIVNSTITVY